MADNDGDGGDDDGDYDDDATSLYYSSVLQSHTVGPPRN